MDEIILGASYMINNDIFTFFCFSTFSFRYCRTPVVCHNFKKKLLKTGSKSIQRKKLKKLKMLKMLLSIICEVPKNMFSHFWHIFYHFYPISPAIFAAGQKFAIDHFRDPPILDRLGK